jgi:hypothetical protein
LERDSFAITADNAAELLAPGGTDATEDCTTAGDWRAARTDSVPATSCYSLVSKFLAALAIYFNFYFPLFQLGHHNGRLKHSAALHFGST